MFAVGDRIQPGGRKGTAEHGATKKSFVSLSLVCSETYQQRPVSQAAKLKLHDGFLKDVDPAAAAADARMTMEREERRVAKNQHG